MSNSTATWNFTYNSDGLRTKRTNGTTTYNYVYNGDKLSQMTMGSDVLNFSYDASGTPITVQYNGTTYYYVTNIQGDVIAILDSTGAAVVEYSYDAWGNPIVGTENSATSPHILTNLNPLRYRSYVFDPEYGLYHLQSRYYNPETSRFLNADALTSTGQGLLGNNMFAYCKNNPIMCIDPDGYCTEVGALLTWVDCGKQSCPTSSKRNPTRYYSGDNIPKHEYYVKRHQIEYVNAKLESEIRMNQIELFENAAQSLQDAYNTSYSIQQNQHMAEAQMMIDNFSTVDRAKKSLNTVGAELCLIGAFWGGPIVGGIGAGLLFVSAIMDIPE